MGSHTPVEVLMPRTQVWVSELEARQHMGQAVLSVPHWPPPCSCIQTGRTQCKEQDCPFLYPRDADTPAPRNCLSVTMALGHLSVTTGPLPCSPQGSLGTAVSPCLGLVMCERAVVSCQLTGGVARAPLTSPSHIHTPSSSMAAFYAWLVTSSQLLLQVAWSLLGAPILCPAPSRLS